MNRGVLAAYGLLGLPLAVVGLPLVIYLPQLYAQEHAMALAVVGSVLLVVRLGDVFVDPFIGLLSDRFTTPFGRRRPWIALGTALTVVGVLHIYDPPAHPSGAYLFGWLAVLYLGWSMVSIPYLAWGGGLSTSYHLRSVITGVREFFALLGIVVASVAPALHPGALTPSMHGLAQVIAVLMPLAALLLIVVVPEPRVPPAVPVARAWMLLWRNGPFRLLMGAALLGGIGTAMNGALLLFYLQQMNLGDHKELLAIYLLAALLGVPLWVWVAGRVGKHRALAYATMWGCAWFAMVPFVPAGSYWIVALINLMSGCTIGASPVLGASMAADVIDWDALRAKRDRSALFFSLWSMAAKLTQALGILALPVVAAFGFTPTGPNGPGARFALTAMYCLVPIGFWLGAISLIWNFPLDHRRQALIAARRALRA
jgi:GPH family glycoside/pentoside/hexuronide:cation symporter